MTIPPWTTAPQAIAPQDSFHWTFTPRQLPLNNSPLDNYHPDNYPLWNPLRVIIPWNFAHQTITPEWCPLNNCPLDNYPHEIPVYINNRNTKECVKLMIYGNKTYWLEKIITQSHVLLKVGKTVKHFIFL